PDKATHFKDPSIAALAGRILDGTADLRDRRAWYEISLLYAPFDSLPPAGWRQRALRDGEAISLAAHARAAALDAGEGPGGAGTGTGLRSKASAAGSGGAGSLAPLAATYAWSSLGPTSYVVTGASDLAQGRASALWAHPT